MIKGSIHSVEARQKMSGAALLNGNRPPSRKGTTFVHLDQTKDKIRLALVGHRHSAETRRRQSEAKMGIHLSEATKLKISNFNKSIGRRPPTGLAENSSNWKGDDVKYSGLHMWVRSRLGTPRKCEHCDRTDLPIGHYHWANIDHSYKRTLSDWLRLCVGCHRKYDLKQNA